MMPWKRIITALLLVPPVILGVILVPTAWLALVLGVITVLGAWEWTRLAGLASTGRRLAYSLLVSILLLSGYFISHHPVAMLIIIAGLAWWTVAIGVLILTEARDYRFPDSRALGLCIGLLVLIPAYESVILIHARPDGNGPMHLLYLLVLIWTADIAAFFTGRRWGKRRLAPRISPGKSWEGVLGALVGCTILVLLINLKINLQIFELIILIIVSLCVVVVSIAGDLLESLMKRRGNLKDSGNILPGHGGVLDRIDSLTAAAPLFLLLTSLMGWVL